MTKTPPPIVYLDQCHWITLARAQFARHKIQSPEELDAADFILKAAKESLIRLPLSGGHMIETAKAGSGLRAYDDINSQTPCSLYMMAGI